MFNSYSMARKLFPGLRFPRRNFTGKSPSAALRVRACPAHVLRWRSWRHRAVSQSRVCRAREYHLSSETIGRILCPCACFHRKSTDIQRDGRRRLQQHRTRRHGRRERYSWRRRSRNREDRVRANLSPRHSVLIGRSWYAPRYGTAPRNGIIPKMSKTPPETARPALKISRRPFPSEAPFFKNPRR
jgi:hypothetical protein